MSLGNLITILLLVGVIIYSFIFHYKLNKNSGNIIVSKPVVTPSSIAKDLEEDVAIKIDPNYEEKSEKETVKKVTEVIETTKLKDVRRNKKKKYNKNKDNSSNVQKEQETSKDESNKENINTIITNPNEEIVEKVEKVKETQSNNSNEVETNIKDNEVSINSNELVEEMLEDNEIVFSVKDRIFENENDEETIEFLEQKTSFEKIMDIPEEEIIPIQKDISYKSTFDISKRKEIAQKIVDNTDGKWYEQTITGQAIEKITPAKEFVVEEYKW